jgi:hypothetical protein
VRDRRCFDHNHVNLHSGRVISKGSSPEEWRLPWNIWWPVAWSQGPGEGGPTRRDCSYPSWSYVPLYSVKPLGSEGGGFNSAAEWDGEFSKAWTVFLSDNPRYVVALCHEADPVRHCALLDDINQIAWNTDRRRVYAFTCMSRPSPRGEFVCTQLSLPKAIVSPESQSWASFAHTYWQRVHASLRTCCACGVCDAERWIQVKAKGLRCIPDPTRQ